MDFSFRAELIHYLHELLRAPLFPCGLEHVQKSDEPQKAFAGYGGRGHAASTYCFRLTSPPRYPTHKDSGEDEDRKTAANAKGQQHYRGKISIVSGIKKKTMWAASQAETKGSKAGLQ